ncbi:putative uncharacterized transposon-derived protein F52C9.6 [Nymphon striatum]|nr:putative uncharacterized transposon-derived protein F52C9.6 [Nymphon striatum]
MVEELSTASNKVGLEINLSKTKVMFNRNVEIQPIMTENMALYQVDRYIYLGQLISIHRDWEPEVKRRVALVSYGAESWTFSKEVIRRIRAFEGWCYRRVLKISWKDHVTNEMVEEKMECKRELVRGIGQRKMRFAGHVLRGSSGELSNLVLEGTIDGKRDRGKQRRTWSDDVKNWSRTGNLGKAKRKAEDKSLWHSIVVNLRIEDDT